MREYLDLVEHVLSHGFPTEDRTGTGTLSVFGYQLRLDLEKGFPLITTKKMPFRLIVSELLWFLRAETNIRYLVQHNNHIWDDWPFERYRQSEAYAGETMAAFADRVRDDAEFAARWGDLGPVYGKQWRCWQGPDGTVHDQVGGVVETIRTNPHSRRMLVVAYNPGEVTKMALPPCHALFQFYVNQGRLSCQLYQRSADVFLGVPFNIASYALLTSLVAQVTGLQVGEFIHTFGDVHIYRNHIDQCKLQLTREPLALPKLALNPAVGELDAFTMQDIQLVGYRAHPAIQGEVSV